MKTRVIRSKINRLLCVCFLSTVVLYGCGTKPQAELEVANAAIKAAENAKANVYLPAEYAALCDSMTAIRTNIQDQGKRIFKNYGEAKENLVNINKKADAMIRQSTIKEKEIMAKDDTLLSKTRILCKENEQLINDMSRREKKKVDFDKIKSEHVKVNITMTEAQDLFNKGDYMATFERAESISLKAMNINQLLKQAKMGK